MPKTSANSTVDIERQLNAEREQNERESSNAQNEAQIAAANLEELNRIKQEADAAKREPKKKMGFFSRLFSFFKFNSRYKKGDMTTGQNKTRSNNQYEDFLLSKVSFQQGGTSAYQNDANASLQMSLAEGATAGTADISSASLSQNRTDQGSDVGDVGTTVTYKNKLKMMNVTANFKHRILGSSTAEYSAEKAQLLFMNAFRDLTIKDGKMNITHNYTADTDKFGSIVSMSFPYASNQISFNDFFIRDGEIGPDMTFLKNSVTISTPNAFSAVLSDITADNTDVTAASASLKTQNDMLGMGKEFALNGSLGMNDTGFTADSFTAAPQKVANYKNMLNAETAAMKLAKGDGRIAPADGLTAGIELTKWNYGFRSKYADILKAGERTDAFVDTNGLVHIPTEAGAAFNAKIFNKVIPFTSDADGTDIILGDNTAEIELHSDSTVLMGKVVKGLSLTVGQEAGKSHFAFKAASIDLGDESEKMSATDVSGEIGQDGLRINTGKLTANGVFKDTLSADVLTGDINDLSVTKQGVFFKNISVNLESVEIEDVLEADNLTVALSRTAETGLGLKVDFKELALDIENENENFSLESDGLVGSFSVNTKDRKINLATTAGFIRADYDNVLSFTLKGLGIANSIISATDVHGSYTDGAKEKSILDDMVKFTALTTDIKQMNIGKSGVVLDNTSSWKVTAEDLKVFDKGLGMLTIIIDKTGFLAKLEDIPDNFEIDLFGGAKLSMGGGIGVKYTNKMPGLITDNLEVGINYDKYSLKAKGFKKEEKSPIEIGSVSGSVELPSVNLDGEDGKPASFELTGETIKIDTASKKVSFEKIFGALQGTATIIDGLFTVGNAKLFVLNDFTGFGFGGTLGVNSKYFNAQGSLNVAVDKSDGYKIKLESLENISAEIPKFAKMEVEKISEEDGEANQKVVKLEGLSLQGSFDKSKFEDEGSMFYKLAASAKGMSFKLAEATYSKANGFQYDIHDLTYTKDKFELEVTDNLTATLDMVKKSLAIEYEIKLPKDDIPDAASAKKNSIPHQLSLEVEAPICPGVSVGGGIFAGGCIDAIVADEFSVDTTEKNFTNVFSIDVKKAMAGVGVEAFLGLGIPKIGNIQVGIRGVLAGNADGSSAKVGFGLTYKDSKLSMLKDEKSTFIEYDLKASLAARLEAFVRAKLFAFINKELFTFNLAEGKLFDANLKGKGFYDENGKWGFVNESASLTSGFQKDIFDPNNAKSVVNVAKQQAGKLDTIKDFLNSENIVLGMGETGTEEAFVKSSEIQSKVFPKFDEIRKINKEAYEGLLSADKNYISSVAKANKFILKHKNRLFQASLAKEDIDPVLAKNVLDNIKLGTVDTKGDFFKDTDFSFFNEVEPVKVYTLLTKKYNNISISPKKFKEMSGMFIKLRSEIKRIDNEAETLSSQENDLQLFKEYFNEKSDEFNTFRKTKDDSFDSLFKDNKSKFKDLQSANIALVKINDKINKYFPEIEKNLDKLEEAEKMSQEKKSGEWFETNANNRAKEFLQKNGIDEKLLDIYRNYLSDKKDKTKAEQNVVKARDAIDADKQKKSLDELTRQSTDFNEKHTVLVAARTNYINHSKGSEDSKEAYSGVNEILEKKPDMVRTYDISPIVNIYPSLWKEYSGQKKLTQEVSGVDFQAFSKKAIQKNNDDNISVYRDIMSEIAHNSSDHTANTDNVTSDELNIAIFSSHTNNAVRNARTTNKNGYVSLDEMIANSNSRIAEYEGKISLINDTVTRLEKNINESNDQYISANRLFMNLSAIKETDFAVKASYGGTNGKDSMTASSKMNNALNTLDEASTKLSENGDFGSSSLNNLLAKSQSNSQDVTNKLPDMMKEINKLEDDEAKGSSEKKAVEEKSA